MQLLPWCALVSCAGVLITECQPIDRLSLREAGLEIGQLEFWGWSSLIWSSLHGCLSVLYKYNKNFLCVPRLVKCWDALRQESVPPVFIFSSLFPNTLPAGFCLSLLMEITDLGFSLKCSFLLFFLWHWTLFAAVLQTFVGLACVIITYYTD